MRHIVTFRGQCNCGCPELYLDPGAEDGRRVVLTDDFGQRIQMSITQFAAIIDGARAGVLDSVLSETHGSPAPVTVGLDGTGESRTGVDT